MSIALRVTACTLWAAAIATAALVTEERVFTCILAAAVVASLAALQSAYAERIIRTYDALTRAVITRPLNRSDTGPIPVVTELRPAGRRGQPAGPSSRDRRHARHATR